MISLRQKLNMAFISTLSLVFVFGVMQLLQWCFVFLGASFSGFEGQFVWEGFTIKINSTQWNMAEVLWIYLFPYFGFIIAYFILNLQRKHPINKPNWALMILNWAYLLIVIQVFFLPLWEIINYKGIYHALLWLNFSRWEQFVFGAFMMMIFIFRNFRVSSIFSSSLILPSNKFIRRSQILPQLIFLWLIPFLALSVFVFLGSGFVFSYPNNYFLSGILMVLIINVPLITKYEVIIK